MDSVVAAASTAWRSARLVYRPFDAQDEELQAWMHEHVSNDPVVEALSTGDLLRPQTRKQSAAYVDAIAGCLIAVVVCLREDDDDVENEGVEKEERKLPSGDEPKTASAATGYNDVPNNTTTGKSSSSKSHHPRRIGFAALHATAPSAPHHRSADVALCLVAGAQGRGGLGGEALAWLVDWGFRHGGLHRVGLQAAAYNERALALYRRAGFVEEGRLRGRVRFDRRWWDLVAMGMLEEEWEARRDEA
ncbi:hypothetical protein JDV02_005464 [Purpureocillium takamizusanense]|uniref:N-acetyltransferase domain-containing protein n=1 Tax=Purpureocillium takamizusanense TaxID=2060973 RepID=A0A9Q8QGK4_9HYPO|nr:uncharacterized protein JDV02_005464 [Purpureocillium takamizusanense]UNI19270.1 hypothetical protein JDV02_005464 [Purpureocillium takamizusanense]